MIYFVYALVVLIIVVIAIFAVRVLFPLFRSAQVISKVNTDEFRLSRPHMWTESHHANDGGSFELMRLPDDNLILVSVGVTTVKVFLTPDRADLASYRELKEFSLPNALERVQWSAQKRHSEDLLFLERVRRAIGWPTSGDDLAATLGRMDNELLLNEA